MLISFDTVSIGEPSARLAGPSSDPATAVQEWGVSVINSGEFPVIVTTQAGPSFSFHSRALALDLCLTRVPVPPVPQSWT